MIVQRESEGAEQWLIAKHRNHVPKSALLRWYRRQRSFQSIGYACYPKTLFKEDCLARGLFSVRCLNVPVLQPDYMLSPEMDAKSVGTYDRCSDDHCFTAGEHPCLTICSDYFPLMRIGT